MGVVSKIDDHDTDIVSGDTFTSETEQNAYGDQLSEQGVSFHKAISLALPPHQRSHVLT